MDYLKSFFNSHPGKIPEPTYEIWNIDGNQTYVYREHEYKEPKPDKQYKTHFDIVGDMDHQFYDEEEAARKVTMQDIRKFGKEEIYEILGAQIKYIIYKEGWRYRFERKFEGLKVRNSRQKTFILPDYKLRKDWIYKNFSLDKDQNELFKLNFTDYENVPDNTKYRDLYKFQIKKLSTFKRPQRLKNINERYWLDLMKHLDSKSDLRKYLEEDGWINTEPDYKYNLKF